MEKYGKLAFSLVALASVMHMSVPSDSALAAGLPLRSAAGPTTPHRGALDPSFGNAGRVVTKSPPSTCSGSTEAAALQSDGKIIVAGCSSQGPRLIRYLSDGLLDPSFGTGGIDQVHLPNTGLNAVALQSDGKVVIAIETALQSGGFATSGVARLTSNGSLDKTFGNGGFANVQSPLQLGMGHSLVVQSDGRIVIDAFRPGNAPIEDIGLARFLANGTLDSTFGHNGVTLIPNLFASVSGLAVAQDGTLDALINSGFPGYAVHFSASGTFIEAPPSGNLAVITPAFNRMTFQPDAKIIGASLISRSSGGFVERFTRYNSTDPTSRRRSSLVTPSRL